MPPRKAIHLVSEPWGCWAKPSSAPIVSWRVRWRASAVPRSARHVTRVSIVSEGTEHEQGKRKKPHAQLARAPLLERQLGALFVELGNLI